MIPKKKRDILLDAQHRLPKYIISFIETYNLENWSLDDINSRSTDLSELCYGEVFSINDTFPKISKQQLDKF
jgi:hypothetical protein